MAEPTSRLHGPSTSGLGGGAHQRSRPAGTHCAGEHDAAAEQRAAIDQAVAGDEFERRGFSTGIAILVAHGISP